MKNTIGQQITIKPTVGNTIYIEDWAKNSNGYTTIESLDSWDKAEFRITTGNTIIPTLAANVEITGRTYQMRGCVTGFDESAIRVKVTIVGDGEPDTVLRGYMKIDWKKNVVVA